VAKVTYNGQIVDTDADTSLLEALLTQGCEIPNSCRAGACQSCLMQATKGEIPAQAQAGLKETLKAQGYLLACRCYPHQDMEVRLPASDAVRIPVTVVEEEMLAADVKRLRVRPEADFVYRPGQYVTLWCDARLGRSYSLASVPGRDDHLEMHIKLVPDGRMSRWVHEQLHVGDRLLLQGPAGNCFYVPGAPRQNLLLAGTGTGLAPLYGIARDALLAGHQGDIYLLHGAPEPSGLYLREELAALARVHENFHYISCVLASDGPLPEGVQLGAIDELALGVAPSLVGWKIYLCGVPQLVNQLRKKIFLAGAGINDIYADPFLSAADARKAAA